MDLPIGKHSESETSDLLSGKHVQQMCTIREVYIVVTRTMGQEIVHTMECRHVRYRCIHVTTRVDGWEVHVPFGIYGI